jgi:hypothetical protein
MEVYDAELRNFVIHAVLAGLGLFAATLPVVILFDLLKERLSRDDGQRRSTGKSNSRIISLIVSLRYGLSNFYKTTAMLHYLQVFWLSVNFSVCIVYVVGTYKRDIFGAIRALNIVCGILFVTDIIIELLAAESAVRFALSLNGFFQIISVPSLFLANGARGFLHLGFLRAHTAYVNYIAIDRRTDRQTESSNQRFTLRLLAKAATLIFILAGCVQLLEIPGKFVASNKTYWISQYSDICS